MLLLVRKSRFKKDYKKLKSSGKDLNKLRVVIELLVQGNDLPSKNRDHFLIGKYKDFRECHIEPDWLMIYKLTPTELILVRTGSHSELFG
jgi:mRNA interferase YafQ